MCDPRLSDVLADAVRELDLTAPRLSFRRRTRCSDGRGDQSGRVLFVRCRGGVSHPPDEHAAPEDMGIAVAALTEAISAIGSDELR